VRRKIEFERYATRIVRVEHIYLNAFDRRIEPAGANAWAKARGVIGLKQAPAPSRRPNAGNCVSF